MELNSSLASRLYADIHSAVQPGEERSGLRAERGGANDFAKAAASFVETLRQGEETAKAGLAGRADAHSVVAALASSELAIQTAVTMRDKVVEAYQEILRMPV
ncbi:flagellar hook-basal body complex protein FliE [Oceanicella actignis]|uniref:Flagellar hook-basal body complex protein FliE n=1 Tax=Oceanicella actignis TaxID=1189325 RepID=A0A1M7T4D0_9RHOB|nr:flagellar hook-basal body complex protein FliE [Oceanicella actignis]TYO88798.1 flagellar hook-basal body complex protein FliE [Oceanicella actignis]SET41300.1 flagellar hook-basal body complex protein FliE [Oceanicella actignis]SHN65551.1 flagellar hook-basal body complex protein FliE [Oceanicella actignis]